MVWDVFINASWNLKEISLTLPKNIWIFSKHSGYLTIESLDIEKFGDIQNLDIILTRRPIPFWRIKI